MMNLLLSLFDKKFEHGVEREIDFSVPIPLLGHFGISMLPSLVWIQFGVILAIQSIMNCFVATLIYTFIVPKRGSAMANLLGYWIIIPFICFLPFYFIDLFDVRNVFLRFGLSIGPIMTAFHCLAALHGTTPRFVEKSLRSYIVFYASPIQLRFDEELGEAIPASRTDLFRKAQKCLSTFVLITLLFSLLDPCAYEFVPKRSVGDNFLNLFHWRNLLNNYLLAYLTCACLEIGSLMIGLAISMASGMSTVECHESPLLTSTSPSDFWGKRWNVQVHTVLKHGVYLPVRKFAPKALSAACTFLASGLMHEYLIAVLSYKGVDGISGQPYFPSHGTQFAFFAWNGVLLVLEHLLKGNPFLKGMRTTLPAPAITALVLLTALPIGHLFTDEYIANGMYSSMAVAFPYVKWNKV